MKLFWFHNFCSYFVVTISKRYKSVGKGADTKMKVFLQKRNPLTGSMEWDIGVDEDEYDYHQEIARSAFADMLHDSERNNMYYRALRLAIDKMHQAGKKANVLDIGTGTGLLSMMAVKCGADTVTACEAFRPMAECCLKILKKNGVADKIKVIPKRSTEITVGEGGDMDKRANILVTEVFDTELIGEGALSTFSHAHEHLLEKDCIVVPDSAVIYAQVVECPMLLAWNKLQDVDIPELGVKLKTPEHMSVCGGAASVHDVQLSALRGGQFRALSPALAALRYDWSGRAPPPARRARRAAFSARPGAAHAVFVWWDLYMDTEGEIVLSCAPWWQHPAGAPGAEHPAGAPGAEHPAGAPGAEHPADRLPWRDHWMQAVYYLPNEATLEQNQEVTLVSCHDEYSLWFSLESAGSAARDVRARPACSCGAHAAWPRAHVARVNCGARRARAARQLQHLEPRDVLLDLNGSNLLGLSAAKLVSKVYILESSQRDTNILKDYIAANDINNVQFVSELDSKVLSEVSRVCVCPERADTVLPWDELRAASVLLRHAAALRRARVSPAAAELWAMPVEFLHLHKIRVPVKSCEGFDVSIFDELVERARRVSDAALEAQPLWEYAARAAGRPRRLLRAPLAALRPDAATHTGTFPLSDSTDPAGESPVTVNAFAVWLEWRLADGEAGDVPAAGDDPASEAARHAARGAGSRVRWDPNNKYAVEIFEEPRTVKPSSKWSYELTCDLESGRFHLDLDLL